ncbi:uro-adherence factor A-like isoform X2 [Pseudorasbora parva]|uniref:uro-adherence factor A-like isoform X2 n=1 Tax=Pseudorasbora parva TaxID=51549 RepID=UPI00351DCD16
MSYNHPYRNPPDDFSANNDKYKGSQQIHPRDSNAYMSRIRNTSSEQTSLSSSEMSMFPPGKALSFLHSCGLDTEDLKTLAELPEHLITADALPDLLAEIKKKKISRTSSSRSSALQASTSTRSWDDRSNTQSVEYPLDLPVRQSYSLNREQNPNWDDRWGNVQQSSSQTRTYTSSESNYVIEYNHLKDKKSSCDNPSSYATEQSRQKTSVVPQSYGDYGRNISQSSNMSSRDIRQSSNVSSRDISQSSRRSGRDISQSSLLSSRDISQSSHLSSRDISQSSNLSSRDFSQSSHLSSRDISQSSHLSSRDFSQSSHLSSRDISQSSHLSSGEFSQSSHLSSRDVGLPSLLSSRDVGPSSVFSSQGIGSHSLMSRRDIVPPSNLSSRDIGPPAFLSSRDVGPPSLLSIRDLAPTSRLSSRDASQSSHQQRKPVIHTVPTRKEASDFHGKTPPVFPYACVLCEITVLSKKDWSVHVKGPQHANSQLSLVEKYPEWDQTIQSARRNEPGSEFAKSRTPQERGGTSSSRNGSSGSKIRASNIKSESSSSKNPKQTQATTKCKVVCVKFEVNEVDEAYLKKVLGQFGVIVRIIMFPKLAFVEMGTAGQAEDVVKYFLHNPLWFRGEIIQFSLSAAFGFLQSSLVVSFSPLPPGEGTSSELTAIAKRFGSVKNSLFLPSRGYVEMANVEEANKLVGHYSTNSLKLKGKTINVCFSAEYQTLSDVDKEKSPVPYSSRRRRNSSPKRRSRSSRRHSPSPKRRVSEERSRSRRSQDSKNREDSRRSRERTKESSRRDSSSKSNSKKSSPLKDQKIKTEESVEEMVEEEPDIMGDDSDLEGVAVIADDGEELNSEDEFTVDDELYDEEYEITDVLTEQDTLEDAQTVKESNDQTKPSDMDTSKVKPETSECVPTATTSDRSSDCKEAQEFQQTEQKELQQGKPKEFKQEELQQAEQKDFKQEELQKGEQKEFQQGEQKELQQGKQKEFKQEELQQEEQKEFKQEELQTGEQKELQQEEQKDETVEMEKDWSVHVKGPQHANSQLSLVEKNEPGSEIAKSRTPQERGGTSSSRNGSSGSKIRASNIKSESSSSKNPKQTQATTKCKVVCVIFEADEVDEAYLKKVLGQFGVIVKMVMFPKLAFVEMGTAGQAEDIVKYFLHNPLLIRGEIIQFSLSAAFSFLQKETDFPGNLENLPTSDEFKEEVLTDQGDEMEISASVTEGKYGKVLEVAGFPVAKKYSENDLLKIGEKYGDVAACCLVRSSRKVEKALIEMVDADAAAKLEAESKRLRIRLGGKILRITVSKTYSQVNKGVDSGRAEGEEQDEEKNKEPSCTLASSEESTVVMAETETSEEIAEAQKETYTDAIMQMSSDEEEVYGRVLRIRNLPMPDEYTDADFLSIAEPYGKIKRHWMFRLHRTGLIEMENACDAEMVVSAANMNKITVAGKHPKVSVSTKHAHLNKRYFLHGPSGDSIQTSSELEKEFWSDNQDVDSEEDEKQVSDVDGGNGMEVENSDSVSEAQTQMMDPVGTEFVRPVVGYFCSLCNAIYSSEEEAKNDHCRTPLHHQKLKEHKERNSS